MGEGLNETPLDPNEDPTPDGTETPGDPVLAEKHRRLAEILKAMGRVVVTFSGGVDSALVLKVAVDELGPDALALTADSPTFPPEECAEAVRFAREIGARHLVVDAHELEREGYARNGGDRCYFCKTELFDLARDTAAREGFPWIADGTIVDDLSGHRPGLKAATEHGVRHPLVEAGFVKRDVRALALHLGMPVWDKPSFACLGSRFAVGTRVTLERVGRVGRIESRLRALGLRQFRVRFHTVDPGVPDAGPAGPGAVPGGDTKGAGRKPVEIVRIEVEVGDLPWLVSPGIREEVVAACQAERIDFITMDLLGYRSGSTALLPASATAPST